MEAAEIDPTNTLRAKGRPFAAIQPGHSKVPTWKIGSSGRSFYSYTAAQSSLTPKLSNSSVFLLPLLDFTKMFEFLLINSVLVNFLRGSIYQEVQTRFCGRSAIVSITM